jgi:hypothetical protein
MDTQAIRQPALAISECEEGAEADGCDMDQSVCVE